MIISGGENISSVELESVLFKHPAILEAAVVAMPHPKWGESPCAFVVLKKTGDTTETDILSYCKKNMPKFMVPKKFEFVKELPKTGIGKSMKDELRKVAKTLQISNNIHLNNKRSDIDQTRHHQNESHNHEKVLAMSRL